VPLRSSGVLEVRPYYQGPECVASFIWYVDVGGPPTRAAASAVASTFQQWDAGPFGTGILGYRAFRAVTTGLYGVKVRSIDPGAQPVDAILTIPSGSAGLDDTPMICSQQTALATWYTLPGSLRRRGRTYLPCLGQSAQNPSNPNLIESDFATTCAALLTEWARVLTTSGVGQAVLLSYQRDSVPFADAPISLIERATVSTDVFNTQRRRLSARVP
jgi:hypothetical protein